MNPRKGITAFALLAVMVIAFAGCGGADAPAAPGAGADANRVFPEVITIYGQVHTVVTVAGGTCNNDVGSWQALEEATGTRIEWIYAPSDHTLQLQDFTLLVASGDLPDIIRFGWPTAPGGVYSYYQDGVIINLADLLDSHMPNVRDALVGHNILRNIVHNERDVFFIPEVRDRREMNIFRGPIIREDWLERLGIPEPQTLDELHQTMIAFRDANLDDAPLVWGVSGVDFHFGNLSIDRFLWPFGIHSSFFHVDGVVKYGPMEPEFADALAFIHMLYAEGLLDPDFAIQGRPEMDAAIMNNMVGFAFGFQPSMLNRTMDPHETYFSIAGINWLQLTPDSPRFVFDVEYTSYMLAGNSIAITTAAREPELVANWINFVFSEEGSIITNYGIEGVGHYIVDGQLVFSQEFLDAGERQALFNFGTQSTFPSLRRWSAFSTTLHPRAVYSVEKWAASADVSRNLPLLPLQPDEQDRIAEIYIDMRTYIREQINRIIYGHVDVSEIPAIQDRMRAMGIEEIIAIHQAAFDRLNAR